MNPRSHFQPLLVLALVVLSLQGMSNQSLVSASSAPLEPATEPVPVKTSVTLAVVSYMVNWDETAYGWPGAAQFNQRNNLTNSKAHPLLGLYHSSDPSAIDWQLKWAIEHGITVFFANLDDPCSENTVQPFLSGFIHSRYIDRIRFGILFDISAGPDNKNAWLNWRRTVVESWSTCFFGHPSYYRINGRPVIEIVAIANIVDKFGIQTVYDFINQTRVIAAAHGYNLFLIGDTFSYRGPLPDQLALKFDAITHVSWSWNWKNVEFTETKGCDVLSYAEMVRDQVQEMQGWSRLAQQLGKPFVPVVLPGFDNEKLHLAGIDETCTKFTNPTVSLFKTMIQGVEPYVDKNLNLLFINSWNELGEMHAIEPTEEWGFSYVDLIRDLFGTGNPDSWPKNIAPTGQGYYVEYKTDGTTSTDISINKAWSALDSASNITASIAKNMTSPIFKSGQAKAFFKVAASQYNGALDAFYKNNFDKATVLVRMATESMKAAYQVEQYPSIPSSSEASTMASQSSTAPTNTTNFTLVAVAGAIVLTVIALRLRRRKGS